MACKGAGLKIRGLGSRLLLVHELSDCAEPDSASDCCQPLSVRFKFAELGR